MTDTSGPNAGQVEHWNDVESAHWVGEAGRYDGMLRGLGELAMDAAELGPGDRVLDIGCGSGATTMALAELVGSTGTVTGIDLSEKMLGPARDEAARAGATNVRFELGDAQIHPFPSAAFDVAYSRFGLMFFADPVAAFTNIGRALVPGGRLAFVCWRDLAEQEWIDVPLRAAVAHVPMPQFGKPGDPGMEGLADPERTRAILDGAGFSGIEVRPVDTTVTLGGSGSVGEVMPFVEAGSLGRALLTDAGPEQAAAARNAIREALAPHETPTGVVLGAAVWIVTARAHDD
jgi:SAM-dependent methyltransferase